MTAAEPNRSLSAEAAGRRPSSCSARRAGVVGLALALVLVAGCLAPRDTQVRIVVGTTWAGPAAEALHRELLAAAAELGPVTVELRSFSFYGLNDHLARMASPGEHERLDIVIVPNDWLGQLAQRGVIGELPSARVDGLQKTLIRQALLAVSERDRVLAYPVSAEVLALIYDPRRFPSPPRTIEDILDAPLPPGTMPFAVDLGSAYHLAPLLSSFQGFLVDVEGNFVLRNQALIEVVTRLSPHWRQVPAWSAWAGDDLASLQLQLFAEGRLASFLGGPWLLGALESTGRPFAVMPIPPFADSPNPARALVGYQCATVLRSSQWADLALEISARLLAPEANARLNRLTRRLPVLEDAYRSEAAVSSSGGVGFLRALEQGQFFPAAAHWTEGFHRVGERLQRLTRREQPPDPASLPELLGGVTE